MALAISRSVSLALIVSQLTELSRAFEGLELRLLRGASSDIAEHLKKGEADLALAGPLGEPWERLESWPLFTERIRVAVSKTHRYAGCKAIEPQDLAGERLITRTYCETSEDFASFLKSQRVQPKVSHKMVSERDYLVLLEANLGIGLMPESTARSKFLTCVPVSGLDLSRTVSVYAVAGRLRSPAVSTLIKLLRAGDWPAQIGGLSLARGEAA